MMYNYAKNMYYKKVNEMMSKEIVESEMENDPIVNRMAKFIDRLEKVCLCQLRLHDMYGVTVMK